MHFLNINNTDFVCITLVWLIRLLKSCAVENKLTPLGIIHTSVWIATKLWSDINQTYTTFYRAVYLLKNGLYSLGNWQKCMWTLNADQFSFMGWHNFRPFLYEIVFVNFCVMGLLYKWHVSDHSMLFHSEWGHTVSLYCIWVFHCILKKNSVVKCILRKKNIFLTTWKHQFFPFWQLI